MTGYNQTECSYTCVFIHALLILFPNITSHLSRFHCFAVDLPLTATLIPPHIHLFLCFFASAFSYPDREQLQTIYSAYLQPVLQHSLGSQAAWASTGKTHQLAGSLVQLYEQVLNRTGCLCSYLYV